MRDITKPPTKDVIATVRPEVKLLLCCARTQIDDQTAEVIKGLLLEEIDWQDLLQLAAHHGVIPLLYKSLNTTAPQLVSQPILLQLRNFFHSNTAHNIFLSGELLKLLFLLQENDIPAIPFKGPVLATSVYGNLALRQFTDLDILIHKRDVPKVRQLLLLRGYQRISSPPLTNIQEFFYLQSACEDCFIDSESRVAIEPHWDFIQKYFGIRLNPELLWQRLGETSLAGTTVPTFAPEDSLLIVCINGTKDRWLSLKPICDIAELIRTHPQMDWATLIEQTRVIGCQRILLLGLFLAYDLLEIDLPEIVWQAIATDITIKKLALQVRQQLFDNSLQPSNGFPKLWYVQVRWYLQVRERLQDRISYCFNRAFNPDDRDAAFFPLPASLYWIYSLIRPFRLAVKFGLSLLRQVRIWNK